MPLHRGPVLGDHRPVVRLQPLEELAAHVVDLAQVRRVELADRGDRLGDRRLGTGAHAGERRCTA